MVWEKELRLQVYNETNIWVRLTLDIGLYRINKIWQPRSICQLKLDVPKVSEYRQSLCQIRLFLHSHTFFLCVIFIITIITNIALVIITIICWLPSNFTYALYGLYNFISTIPEWRHAHFLKIAIVHHMHIDQSVSTSTPQLF